MFLKIRKHPKQCFMKTILLSEVVIYVLLRKKMVLSVLLAFEREKKYLKKLLPNSLNYWCLVGLNYFFRAFFPCHVYIFLYTNDGKEGAKREREGSLKSHGEQWKSCYNLWTGAALQRNESHALCNWYEKQNHYILLTLKSIDSTDISFPVSNDFICR